MKKIIYVFFLLVCLTLCGCSKEKFEVKFIGFNDEVIDTTLVSDKEEVKYPNAPTVEGYDFTGWDKDVKNVTENTLIKACYEIKKFTVRFYNANDEVILEQVVNYNEKADAPNGLNVVGYEFQGWDKSFDQVLSDLEIRPILVPIVLEVNFYDIDCNLYETYSINYGESVEDITPPKAEGHKFIGWDADYTNVTGNLDIYPIYEKLPYTVTFVGIYGEVLKTETVYYNESATAPDAPSVLYHTFKKWSLDFSEVKNNMTVKATYDTDFKSYEISNVKYWLQLLSKKYDINKKILTQDEITNYNSKIISQYSKTKVMDVLSITGTKTQSYVLGLINNYANIDRYTVYNAETYATITANEKSAILSNRDLNNIPSTVTVKYGIISDFAWMRSYPTNHYSSQYSMDRFQETSLNVGEGVAIYHESLDKEWYFVQAENYNGWVEKKYIAECSYEELEAFLKPTNNLLVISDYVTLESSHVRMGQSFPLVSSSDDSYVILFPTRNSDGSLLLKELEIAKSDDYHEGYLDYTYNNVFTQAFKLLGIDYSWGDKDRLGRDCSSTMNGIYKCFGFMMPRNTSNQVAIPTYGSKISGLTNTSIQNYKPGTLIFTSSHVMLYIGENANGTAYLLHNTNSGNGECILQSLDGYGGNRINGVLKLQ